MAAALATKPSGFMNVRSPDCHFSAERPGWKANAANVRPNAPVSRPKRPSASRSQAFAGELGVSSDTLIRVSLAASRFPGRCGAARPEQRLGVFHVDSLGVEQLTE